MDWNEFLRPTGKKFLATALAFMLFVPFLTFLNGFCLENVNPDGRGHTTTGCKIETGSILMFALTGFNRLYKVDIVSLLLGVIISYIAACLFVIIYSKYRKQVKK
ncbi:hypothetical protein FJZ26_02585 [Candidatus Parvarchaeota archaeon]|nr:hypothetical protein [Candidatus Parvarchaeota archaeon]